MQTLLAANDTAADLRSSCAGRQQSAATSRRPISGEFLQSMLVIADFFWLSIPSHQFELVLQLDAQGQALEQPLELSFQDQYGDIERHLWFGDGYMLLGFSTGPYSATTNLLRNPPAVAAAVAACTQASHAYGLIRSHLQADAISAARHSSVWFLFDIFYDVASEDVLWCSWVHTAA